MKRLEAFAAAIFGIGFLLLALAVAVETIMRKVFNRSLQGVDELGGYILAAGAALSMAAALVSRAHIRIDLLHDFMPKHLRIVFNLLASFALLACATLLARMAWIALDESILFRSTAQTPWATPLWIPQAIWFGTLLLLCAVAAGQAGWLLWLAVKGQWPVIDRNYGPRGAKDELQDELDDLRKRSGTAAGEPA